MRLGLLGPAGAHQEDLARAASFLVREVEVDRALYLGIDRALDGAVRGLAERLVGGDPSDEAIWQRAADRCLAASAAEIDAFLAAERERKRLALLEALPGDGTRAIEILDGRVAVMIYDKADLDEEDILPATFLLFGKSREAVVKQVGNRWFLAPGSFAAGGVMTLEERDEGVELVLYDGACKPVSTQTLAAARAAKIRVHA